MEVPKKKSDFTNRLTLLYSAIHRYVYMYCVVYCPYIQEVCRSHDNHMTPSLHHVYMYVHVYTYRREACSHIVLLTSRWQLQAGLLKSMMERTNQQLPQPLLDMTVMALQVLTCLLVYVQVPPEAAHFF